ncbi:hypothetical protein C5167_011738 [Papaver somniferum]|nr:hypothetical protein C5167_011738 [Papaver somniferum]
MVVVQKEEDRKHLGNRGQYKGNKKLKQASKYLVEKDSNVDSVLCLDWNKKLKQASKFLVEKDSNVIAITVEEEDDIVKFSDYKASLTASSGGAKSSPEPSPPKKRRSPVKGTGPDSSIVKDDIDGYLGFLLSINEYISPDDVASKASSPKDKATTQSSNLDYTELPHTQIAKITASHLLQSKQIIPHYYLIVYSCVDNLMQLRSQLNSVQEDSGGKQISVNDLVVKAAALALRKVPQCNSSYTNDYICQPSLVQNHRLMDMGGE